MPDPGFDPIAEARRQRAGGRCPSAPPVEPDLIPARRHGVSGLSMGMSGDYEKAIPLGATYIRIGTAIFGERD